MKETARLQELLSQLEFKYTYRKLNEDIEEFEIVVDAEDDLRLSGLLYHADEECFFRLYGYVDVLIPRGGASVAGPGPLRSGPSGSP